MTHQTTAVFKALADDMRLTIVRRLAGMKEPVASCDLVKACASFSELSQPAMSHHFSKLVDAQVVLEQKKGVQKTYLLNTDFLHSIGVDPSKI